MSLFGDLRTDPVDSREGPKPPAADLREWRRVAVSLDLWHLSLMKHPTHVAAVGEIGSQDVIQFEGLPDHRERKPMRAATHLVIVPDDDGCTLIRFADDAFAGDTWHENLKDAKNQAASEYGLHPDHWIAVAEGDEPPKWSGQAIRGLINAPPNVS